MSYGTSMTLSLWTDDPELARAADTAGVDRIGLDLEQIGKTERQGHLGNTRISFHKLDRLPKIRSSLQRAKLFVRTNPLHEGTTEEIEQLLSFGAQVLMLPMFTHEHDVAYFSELVAGRAEVVPLLETATALERRHELMNLPGIREIYVGLNDLSISLGLRNHFEAIQLPEFGELSSGCKEHGIRFGFGGLGRPDDTSLPIPADLVYAVQPWFNCGSALLSRVFFRPDSINGLDLSEEIEKLRARLDFWSVRPGKDQHDALLELDRISSQWSRYEQ